MHYGTLQAVPRNNLRYWRLQRKLSIADMAFTSGVSPRLITKIEAAPADYVIKSDTIAKISAGLNVPAFMLFFPDDVVLLNTMMQDSMMRQTRAFSQEGLVSTFQYYHQHGGSSLRQPQSRAANTR